jgi:hypothetical protein
MSNKRAQISLNGTTFYTFPGNTAEFMTQLNETTDTIFGQPVESQQPNIGEWNMQANAIVKNVTGYNAVISQSGTPTVMTAEPCSLVSGKTYQVTNAAHRVISYLDTLTVFDNSVNQTANVANIDYLAGTITFLSTYTPTGPITVTGKYVPLTPVSKAKSFTLTQTCTAIDQTGYDDAQANGGYRVYAPGLDTISLELGNIFKASQAWQAALVARSIVYVQIDLDTTNPGLNVFRAFMKIESRDQSGNQGAVEEEKVTLRIWVPDGALVLQAFSWYIAAGSTMNTAIQYALQAFLAQSTVTVRYLPSGAPAQTPLDGQVGTAFPIEATIENTVDGLNTFTFNFRGTGAPTPV